MAASDGYLSKRHVAERLDVSTRTIDRLRAAGELDWIRVGKRIRISIASLEAYEQRRRPYAEIPEPADRLPIPALASLLSAKGADGGPPHEEAV